MYCHKRGRAGGVHADRWALQSHEVGDPSRGHAGGASGEPEALELLGTEELTPIRSKDRDDAREHSCRATAQRGGIDPRMLEGLPSAFQKQPLLGVHSRGLAWADRKE